jgi:predicted GNAT family N-acyltransferase
MRSGAECNGIDALATPQAAAHCPCAGPADGQAWAARSSHRFAMSQLVIMPVTSPARQDAAFAIRRKVFVQEQGVSESLEIDGRDGEAWHLLALLAEHPVGTLRVRRVEDGQVAKIERVAVLAEARGHAVGQALMQAALARAAAEGCRLAKLHAQLQVQGFYAKLGFEAYGPEFEEDGIMHVAMRRPLAALAAAAAG